MANARQFDIVVVGTGSGLTAAYYAQRAGKSVAVVEERPEAIGGTCTNRGCIPTKGLIQTAEVMKTIRQADEFGIYLDQSSVRVDFKAVMETVRKRRAKSASGAKGWVDETFAPFYGTGRFVGEKTLEMEDGTRVAGKKVFVAAGASPRIPPIPGLESMEYWTNETVVLEIEQQPESLVILGGGYIGCELGHFFSALGTKVTVVDKAECLLREDDDIRELFTREFGEKVELVMNASVKEVIERGGKRGFVVEHQGKPRAVLADEVLVATGRRPNTERLDLSKTGVETDERGFIKVDERLRTSHPDIYAFGDVIGQGMFKHTAAYEAEIAYKNSQGGDFRVSYLANPHAVFTDPQIGSVGLTESECRNRGLSYRTAKTEYGSIAKGQIVGSPPGFAKLIVEEETDRILGFHMVGPNSADLVHEVVVAMTASGAGEGPSARGWHLGSKRSGGEGRGDRAGGGLTAQIIRDTIHTHPTLAELVKQVFDEAT